MRGMATAQDGWDPPVLRTTAVTGEGVAAVCDALDAHLAWAQGSGARTQQRRRSARVQVREIVLASVRRRLQHLEEGALLEEVLDEVVARKTDPYAAADSLIARLDGAAP